MKFNFLAMSVLAAFVLCLGCVLIGLLVRRASSMAYVAGTHSIVYVTAPNEETAKNLSRGAVEKKLAACVNIVPKITSIYEWDNKITEDNEVLMIIKTRGLLVPELTEYIKSNHPYDVCEVISTPIENGSADYLNWISSVCKKS